MKFLQPATPEPRPASRAERGRERIRERGRVEFDVEFNPDPKLRAIAKTLKTYLDRPENFLDDGGAAEVFELGREAGVCVKLIKNKHRQGNADVLDLGNDIRQEAMFLRQMTGFSVNGVRSPSYISILTGNLYGALVMERLDAVNFQHVLNGEAALPASVNPQAFFDDLDAYITVLHDEQQVSHMDLEPRNIMIDNQTGKPIVIDFGRSVSLKNLSSQQRREREEDDLGKLEAAERALLAFLDKKPQ